MEKKLCSKTVHGWMEVSALIKFSRLKVWFPFYFKQVAIVVTALAKKAQNLISLQRSNFFLKLSTWMKDILFLTQRASTWSPILIIDSCWDLNMLLIKTFWNLVSKNLQSIYINIYICHWKWDFLILQVKKPDYSLWTIIIFVKVE